MEDRYRVKKYYLLGYVMLPCFTIKTMVGEFEAQLTCGPVLEWIFKVFFAPFWRGRIVITGQEVEE